MENLGNWRFRSTRLLNLSGADQRGGRRISIGDGDLDIASLVSQEWEEVYAFVNDGRGHFEPRLIWGSTNDDFGSSWLTAVDLDKDGDVDFLYSNGDAFDYAPPSGRPWHGVQWLENTGALNFTFHRLADFSGASSPQPADLDGDGDLDVVVVSAYNAWDDPSAQSLVWLENDGRMRFAMHDVASVADAPGDGGGRRSHRRRPARSGDRRHAHQPAVRSDVADHDVDQWLDEAVTLQRPCSCRPQATSASHRASYGELAEGLATPVGLVISVLIRPRRSWLIAVVLLAVLAAVGVGLRVRSRAAAAAMLPPMPDLAGQPPAVVEHLQQRRRAGAPPPDVSGRGRRARPWPITPTCSTTPRPRPIAPPPDPRARRLALAPICSCSSTSNAARPRRPPRVCARSSRPTRAWRWRGCGLATRSSSARATRRPTRRTAARRPAPARSPRCPPPLPARRDTIPVGAYAALGRARVALQQGQVERARQSLEKLVADAPRFGAAHRLLGDTYQRLGGADKAARHVARAAALPAYNAAPDPMVDALARESRSSVLLLKQASAADLVRDAAWREYLIRRALEFDAANPDVVYEMGALLQQLKRPREALPYFEHHLDMVSDDQQTLVQIGKCYSGSRPVRGGRGHAPPRPRTFRRCRWRIQPGLRAGAGWTGRRGRASLPAGTRVESRARRGADQSGHRAGAHAGGSRTRSRTLRRRCGSSRATPPLATTSAPSFCSSGRWRMPRASSGSRSS